MSLNDLSPQTPSFIRPGFILDTPEYAGFRTVSHVMKIHAHHFHEKKHFDANAKKHIISRKIDKQILSSACDENQRK